MSNVTPKIVCRGGLVHAAALVALCALCVTSGSRGWAAETSPKAKIAPLLPRIEPEVATEMAARFQQMLSEAVTAAGHAVVDPDAARAATERANGQMACADAECAVRAQRQLDVGWSLSARINTVGKNYEIDVSAHRGAEAAGQARGRCDICTFREALDRTREVGEQALAQAQALLQALVVPPPVQTEAQPASQPADRTPTDKPAAQEASAGRQWPLWPALTAAGVGVVGLAIGIPLIAIDGKGTNCRGEPREDYRNCERVYDTSGGGWALTTIGVAALATSGVLLYLHLVYADKLPTESEKASRTVPGVQMLSLWPSKKGLVLGAGGTF